MEQPNVKVNIYGKSLLSNQLRKTRGIRSYEGTGISGS